MCILREIHTKILCINVWFALWSSTRSFLCSNNIKLNAKFLMAHTYITITIHPCIPLELCTSLSAAFILYFSQLFTKLKHWIISMISGALHVHSYQKQESWMLFLSFLPSPDRGVFLTCIWSQPRRILAVLFFPTHLYDVVFILAHERNRSKQPLAMLL